MSFPFAASETLIMSDKRGWLEEQFEDIEKEVDSWPDWLRVAAGIDFKSPSPDKSDLPAPSNESKGSLRCRFTLSFTDPL